MTVAGEAQTTVLEQLFEMALQPQRWPGDGKSPEPSPKASPGSRVGEYIASGEGTLEGPRLKGTISWDLFENRDRKNVERTDMFGEITTDDGAEIGIESFGLFQPSKTDKEVFEQHAAVRFATTDERYAWLLPILGRMTGTFDYKTSLHHYRVYAQVDE